MSVHKAGFRGYWIDPKLREFGINNIIVNPADIPTKQKERRHKTTAHIALDRLAKNWGKKYSLLIKTWRQNWVHTSRFSSIRMRLEKSFTLPMQLRQCITSLDRL